MKIRGEYIKVLEQVTSFLLIILWTYAAVGQVLQGENFRIRMSQFPFIGEYASTLVWLVPGVEIIIVLLFFFPRLKDEAYLSSFSLLLVFTAYIIAVLNIADSIPCSCNGVIASLSWKEHIIFNVGFGFLSLVSLLLHPTTKT